MRRNGNCTPDAGQTVCCHGNGLCSLKIIVFQASMMIYLILISILSWMMSMLPSDARPKQPSIHWLQWGRLQLVLLPAQSSWYYKLSLSQRSCSLACPNNTEIPISHSSISKNQDKIYIYINFLSELFTRGCEVQQEKRIRTQTTKLTK